MKTFPVSRVRVFKRWLKMLDVEGKTQYLRELEMWLKSFERYFSIANLPLTEKEVRQTTLRDYSEELNIIADVIFRVSQLCALLLSEEQVSYSSFTRYIENSLKQDSISDNHLRKRMRDQRPSRNLNLMMEALLDVRTIIMELSGLDKISYLCFGSIGSSISREIHKGYFGDVFLERKYEPFFDLVTNPRIVRIVRSVQIPRYKRSIASLFLELYRALRYLHTIGLQMQDAVALKRSLMIFALVYAELKWIVQYIEEEFLRQEHPDPNFTGMIEGIVMTLTMELKKVMQRELLGAASLQQYELIYTRIQNSQGILLNSVQQAVISMASYFDPKLEGQEIFPDYVTRLDQSLKLRADIYDLREYIGSLFQLNDLSLLPGIIKRIEWFKMHSMRYLMYKDWLEFDNFFQEIITSKSPANLNFSLHRFHTFLTTLIKEVNKRSILHNYPFDRPLH